MQGKAGQLIAYDIKMGDRLGCLTDESGQSISLTYELMEGKNSFLYTINPKTYTGIKFKIKYDGGREEIIPQLIQRSSCDINECIDYSKPLQYAMENELVDFAKILITNPKLNLN